MYKIHPASEEDFFKHWSDDWPPIEYYVNQRKVTEKQYKKLEKLIQKKSSERDLERYFKTNKESLSLVMWLFRTGHHATWIFPKSVIRPAQKFSSGLIPDYLLAGVNSGEMTYCVLELKGADQKAFVIQNQKVAFSSVASKGICQLINYIDCCSRDQSYLRDTLQLKSFREPKGILLIGTDSESENPLIRNFKQAWNRICSSLQIRSYNALLREIKDKVIWEKDKEAFD